MKKTVSAFLAVLLTFSIFFTVSFAADKPFGDVPEGSWFELGADFCFLNDFMTGTSEGVFSSDKKMTRAQAAVIFAKLSGDDLSGYTASSFSDVPAGSWFAQAVEWMKDNDISAGTGGGLYSPNAVITREQFAVILMKYAQFCGIDISSRTDLGKFSDAGNAHDWATDALSWAVSCKLMSGTSDTLLSPLGSVTRAQTAVIMRVFTLDVLYSDHTHEWVITCTKPSYCRICGIKNELAPGHDTPDISCTQGCECVRCGEFIPALGHDPKAATCTEASVCTRCGEELAPALGHTTANGICQRCGAEIFPNGFERIKYYLNDGKIFADTPYTALSRYGGTASLYLDKTDGSVVIAYICEDGTGASFSLNVRMKDSQPRQSFECRWNNKETSIASASAVFDIASYVNESSAFELSSYIGDALYKGQFTSIVGAYSYDAFRAVNSILVNNLKTDLSALGFSSIAF